MKKSILFTTINLFFFHFFCSAQNSIIVGPQNDCSLITNNITTSKSKFNVEGISKIRIETFQHRTYDKSRIYDENGAMLWEWNGVSYNDTWYKKEHFLNINSRFIEIEFYQGYRAPFCLGYIKIDKIENEKVSSSSNTPQISYYQNVKKSNSDLYNSDTVFKSVTIGKQEWAQKNLDVSGFRNGDLIPQAKSHAQWDAARTKKQPAWCYYNYDSKNGEKYGKLYNWWAVADPRGLAPLGWHIPTDVEWKILISDLGGVFDIKEISPGATKDFHDQNLVVSKVGKKIKSKVGWLKSEENGSNESGFSGLPGGYRSLYEFSFLGNFGSWWSISESSLNINEAIQFQVQGGTDYMLRLQTPKYIGLSVRCVKGDIPPVHNKTINDLFYNTSSPLIDYWSGETILPDENGFYNIYYATNNDKTPKKFKGFSEHVAVLNAFKFKNKFTCEYWGKGVVFTKANLTKANEEALSANNNSQVKSNGQVENKSEQGANELVKKTITQCNYKFSIPVLNWKYIDNRKLCFYCNARYVIAENFNINEMKKIQIVDSIDVAKRRHWTSINADEVHKKYDDERRMKFLKEKGYGDVD